MDQVLSDEEAMALAIDASQQALQAGNMPFGACLLSEAGELLHVAANNQVSSGDFSGHAEMVLLREASMRLGSAALRGTTLFASGEPCAMCSGALYWAGVRRLFYAASQQDIADCMGGELLSMPSAQVLASGSRNVSVGAPMGRERALQVLRHVNK
jgi:tRNA(Arg) A34 adenosine deaminase TadA